MGEADNLGLHDSCHDGNGCCEGKEMCGPVYRHEDADPEVTATDEQATPAAEDVAKVVGSVTLGGRVSSSAFQTPQVQDHIFRFRSQGSGLRKNKHRRS